MVSRRQQRHGLTTYAQDKALAAMFEAPLTIHLTRDGDEITDAGYQPQVVQLTPPRQYQNTSARYVTNTEAVRFGPWQADAPDKVTGWLLKDRYGRAVHTGRWIGGEAFLRGQEAVIHPEEIRLGLRDS